MLKIIAALSKICKICASNTKTYYHVTKKKNWSKIKTQGLKPQIGYLSKQLDEPVPAIYLFSCEEDADTALYQWLGEAYEEEDELVMLEVEVPDSFHCKHPKNSTEYEAICYDPIPSKYIKFHKNC